jgi:hypothetical protein
VMAEPNIRPSKQKSLMFIGLLLQKNLHERMCLTVTEQELDRRARLTYPS